jgi:hypothetical protein|tara:strand:+ start:658 stop:780 length:123 start_codon:yes stop_codon:yes gene_type:complete
MNEMDKLIESINTFKEIEDLIKAKIYTDKLINELQAKVND